MGLDSYLWKKTSVNNWNGDGFVKYDVTVTSEGKPVEHIDSSKINYIIEEIGYWRKANHIHNWFVQNVQKGVDDCKSYYVEIKELEKLLDICNKVLENPKLGEELLPTYSGFFFGSTEYDEWYLEGIKYTKEILEKALQVENHGVYFEYESSW